MEQVTLITPLRDYKETDSFQMTYLAQQPSGAKKAAGADGAPEQRRYVYRRGKALVFGAGFEHSTEPGASLDGEMHAFLCFTFGTDRQERWPEISQTLGTQSRIVRHPDGELRFSELGAAIEEAVARFAAAGGGES